MPIAQYLLFKLLSRDPNRAVPKGPPFRMLGYSHLPIVVARGVFFVSLWNTPGLHPEVTLSRGYLSVHTSIDGQENSKSRKTKTTALVSITRAPVATVAPAQRLEEFSRGDDSRTHPGMAWLTD